MDYGCYHFGSTTQYSVDIVAATFSLCGTGLALPFNFSWKKGGCCIMKEPDTSEVRLLREKTLWKDRKGRTLLIFQRWYQGGGADYRCVNVDIFLIEDQTLINRPYSEVVKLIQAQKMTFLRDVVVTDPA